MVVGVGRGYNIVKCTFGVNESECIIWLMIGIRFKVKKEFECRIRCMELGIICNMVRGGIVISISGCAVIISGIIISVLLSSVCDATGREQASERLRTGGGKNKE